MSPEQAKGEPIDTRSDLFSLGSVLYTMCTGRPAFRAESALAVMRRVCEDTPRPLREVNPELPEWLCAIVDKLLAKRPEDRFASAAEVAELLGECLAHLQQPSQSLRSERLGALVAKASPPSVDDNPLRSLQGPAWGLISVAGLNWLALLILMTAGFARFSDFITSIQMQTAFSILIPLLALATGVILWGGLAMQRGENYQLCTVASVLAMLIGPGYLLGWPVGIWSLVVLSRPQLPAIRPSSRSKRPSRMHGSFC